MSERVTYKNQKVFQIALSLVFFSMLWLPLAGLVLPIAPEMALQEKRSLAEMPVIGPNLKGLFKFPARFDRYFRDHFEFRSFMVYAFNLLKSRLPGTEIAKQVLTGKEGWYYITTEQTMDDYRGLIHLTPSQLSKMKDALEVQRDRLAEMGVEFLLVFAPAKWEIYPEFVPDFYTRISRDSTLNQVCRYFRYNSDIELLDLRPTLRSAKEEFSIYDGLDTHWSQAGAFTATQAINKRLMKWFPDINNETLSDYEVQEAIIDGDLAVLIGLREKIKRNTMYLIPNNPSQIREQNETDLLVHEDRIRFTHSPELLCNRKALVYHDSFGIELRHFLRESFQESLFMRNEGLDYAHIEMEKPDVVIREVGQRGMRTKLLHSSEKP